MMERILNALVRTGLKWGYPLARITWQLTHPSVHGAHVVLRIRSDSSHEDEILVVRHSYKPGLSVPCGGIHRKESARDGALRELFEEVGIRLHPEQLSAKGEIFLIQDGRKDHGHFFECVLPQDARPEVRIDEREIIWADFLPESELRRLDLLPHLSRYLDQPCPVPTDAERRSLEQSPKVAVTVGQGP